MRFRFAGVELDGAQFSLRVDGQPRACSRKAFELLLVLCRNSDRILSRNALIDALWPGGQVVTDEALTQAIFRARAVLGPYGPLVLTVRGVGLRIDSPVQALDDGSERGSASLLAAPDATGETESAPVEAPAEPLVAASTSAPEPPAPRARRLTATLVIVALLAVLALALHWPDRSTLPAAAVYLDEGYGLHPDDLLAARADTASLLREALANESRGERARAEALLQAIHETDLNSPVPALYRAIWANGGGDPDAARAWVHTARERSADAEGLYLKLLLAYVEASIEREPERIISSAGALLDLRPQAWRMRHARAHLMEFRGMRAAALRELQQIEIPTLGHNKRDMVIADRASMGDVDGAQAILDRLPAAQDPLMHRFLSGRVAWSRGDFSAAHAHFVAASSEAYDIARIDLHARAMAYAAALDVVGGRDADALARVEAARSALGGRNRISEIDLSLFLAELHAAAGRDKAARAELERALAGDPLPSTAQTELSARLAAWRLRPEQPPAPPLDPSAEVEALWRSASALAEGQPEAARLALREALQRGVLSGRMADEARWLELQLGMPVSAARVLDPPYPPLSRVLLRRRIREILAERGVDAGPAAP